MIKKKLFAPALFLALLLSLQVTAWAAAVPTVAQSFTLQSGWNAIYLEVQPVANTPAVVFKDLPKGSSVWVWLGKSGTFEADSKKSGSAQFIQDVGELPVKDAKWLAIFTSATEGGLNNLYAINADSTYLIRLPDQSPQLTMNIVGRPTLRPKGWVPDSFNLTGFGLTAKPTFATFFAPSDALKNQAIYRLNNVTGAWEIVNNPTTVTTATMLSGEAFWIYCSGASVYQGPLAVKTNNTDGLDFGAEIINLDLTVVNQSASDRTVSVAQLSAVNAVALNYRTYNETLGQTISNSLANMPPVIVKAGGSTVIALSVERKSFSGSAASVLEVTDSQGSRVRVPVTASSKPANSYTGLWTGVASLNKVSQLADGSAGTVKDTPAELNLTLILHQDSSKNQVRLLKQVIMMHQDGTLNPDGTPRTTGRDVALTNDALIDNFNGITQKDGAKVGRRQSAIAFDYSPSTDADFGTDFDATALKCTGSISTTVTCRLVLKSSAATTHPTNPFLHKYHPDHDNLAPDFTTFSPEVNEIVRDVVLVFDQTPKVNPDNPPPGWGVSVLGGTYKEQVTGLAKLPVKVEGSFTLKLMSDVDRLNE